jgi:peptidyl-prolyl cis-trans isomerase B (cyclophilin B)
MTTAELHTNKGVMKIEFFVEDAPITVENFLTLARKGYYNNITFHRVIPDFMIQTGDPTGTGGGGPGYTIPDELTGNNQYHDRGVVSMAKTRMPNSGGSQFFICHNRKNTQHLDRVHTVFGKVVEGLEVIDLIRQGDVIEKVVINEEAK